MGCITVMPPCYIGAIIVMCRFVITRTGILRRRYLHANMRARVGVLRTCVGTLPLEASRYFLCLSRLRLSLLHRQSSLDHGLSRVRLPGSDMPWVCARACTFTSTCTLKEEADLVPTPTSSRRMAGREDGSTWHGIMFDYDANCR